MSFVLNGILGIESEKEKIAAMEFACAFLKISAIRGLKCVF